MSAAGKYRAQALAAETPINNVTPLRPDVTVTAPMQAPMRYRFPVYGSLTDTHPCRFIEGDALGSLTELAQVVEVADRKAAQLFSVAVLRDDLEPEESTTRATAHAGVQAVVLDVDSATAGQIDQFDATLRTLGWLHLKYATYSWTSELPRYRYVFPLARVVAGGQNYRGRLWPAFNALSGGICDPNAKDGARRSFVPSCPPGQAGSRPAPETHGTRLLDPDELVALLPPAESPKSRTDAAARARPPDADWQADRRDRDFGLMVAGCSMAAKFNKDGDPDNGKGDSLWMVMANLLHFVRDGRTIYLDRSAKDPRFDLKEAEAKFDRRENIKPIRCTTIEGYGWAGCPTCPSRGKIATPVQLADSLDTTAPDPTAALQQALTNGGIRAVVDQDGVVNYVTSYERHGRRCKDVVRAGSQAANDTLVYAATVNGGKPPTERAIEVAEARIRVEARQSGEVTDVDLRIAVHDGVYSHDLGLGRVLRTDIHGSQLTDESDETPLFRRGTGAGELPDPVFSDSAKPALARCADGFKQLGCTTEQAVIATVWTVDALRPETAKPIFEAVGSAGSGKSILAECVANLIDPPTGERGTTGQQVADLAAVAQQRRVVVIDNASRFDKALSDALCVASTGGTFMARLLYTNGEVAALNLHRSVVITAVSPVCTASDLQSRVVRLEMQPQPGRSYRSESEMRDLMDALRPGMLGAIHTLLSAALRELPEVCKRKDWRHRMVSFDQLGEAMLIAAGYEPGSFLTIIGRMRDRMARRTASGDVFTLKLIEALRALAAGDKVTEQPALGAVLGTRSQLVVWDCGDGRVEITARPPALRNRMPAINSWDRDNPLPATDRAFLDALRRVQPLLGSLGVSYVEESYGSRPMVRIAFNPLELDHE